MQSTQQPIVIDALNYLGTIFCPASLAKKLDPWKRFKIMKLNVQHTVKAFRRANYNPIFVVDAGFSSEEAASTWIGRREREVRQAKRNVFYNADTLLAALLLRNGARVVRAAGIDADDVCVFLARRFKCAIVSGDTDMLRYDEWSPTLFTKWTFDKQRGVALTPQTRVEPTAAKRDKDNRYLTITDTDFNLESELVAADASKLITKDSKYVRGNADENTRAIGNLHALARPLRRALYAHLHIEKVREMYPVWDDRQKTVVWVNEDVYPLDATDPDLPRVTDAQAILAWFRRHDVAAKKLDNLNFMSREFAWMGMTAEIVAATAERPSISLELVILESLQKQKNAS